MKISEVINEDFKVKKDTGTELELEDTENPNVTTKIKKDPNEPASISKNENGEYEIDLDKEHGQVDDKVKPGTIVKQKQSNNKSNIPGSHSKHSSQSNTTQGTSKPQGISL